MHFRFSVLYITLDQMYQFAKYVFFFFFLLRSLLVSLTAKEGVDRVGDS